MKRFVMTLLIIFIGISSGAQEKQIIALGQDSPNATTGYSLPRICGHSSNLIQLMGGYGKSNMMLMAPIDSKHI